MNYPLTSTGDSRPNRHSPLPVAVAGVLASAALLLSLNPAVVAFAQGLAPAAIQADALSVTESLGSESVQARAGTPAISSHVNEFGGRTLGLGASNTQTLTFTNTGTAPVAALAGTASPCAQTHAGRTAGSATDLCDKVSVRIASGGVKIFEGTASAFGRSGAIDVLATSGVGPVAPGESVRVTITVTLSPSLDNSYQGLQISQPIQWRFSA